MLQSLCERQWLHTSCKLLQILSQRDGTRLLRHMGQTHRLLSSSASHCHYRQLERFIHSRLLCRFTLELGKFEKEQENGAMEG